MTRSAREFEDFLGADSAGRMLAPYHRAIHPPPRCRAHPAALRRLFHLHFEELGVAEAAREPVEPEVRAERQRHGGCERARHKRGMVHLVPARRRRGAPGRRDAARVLGCVRQAEHQSSVKEDDLHWAHTPATEDRSEVY